MADDLGVTIGAQISGLLSGLRQATDGVKGFVDQSNRAVGSLLAPFERFQTLLLSIGSIAAGGYVFRDIIQTTIEAASETNKLAKSFGLTADEASALRTQLKVSGVEVDSYMSMHMRLDRQLKTNESSLQSFGLKTRDANGHLLSGQQIMGGAIEWLRQYKDGTDRNIAAQTLFGGRVADVTAILRLNQDSLQRATKDMNDLGLAISSEQIANARAYKVAMGELSLTFEAIKSAIGEAVLPYLTKFALWFREQGPSIIAGMKETVTAVIGFAFDAAEGFVKFAVKVAEAVFNLFVIWQYLKTKFGSSTEAEAHAAIDEFEASVKKLETLRDRAITGLKDVRSAVLAGNAPGTTGPTDSTSGNRSADDLVQAGQRRQAIMAEIETERRLLQVGLADKKNVYDADVANRKITEEQKINLVMLASEQEYQSELRLLDREKSIGGLSVAERQKVLDKIKLLQAEHERDINKLMLDRAAAVRQQYLDVLTPIQSAFDSQLRGLLTKTTSWSDAMRNIFLDLTVRAISYFEKMGIEWVATQLGMTAASTTGAAARAAEEVAAMEATLPARVAKFTSDIMARSAEVFAGVFANLAPIMGPAAAGPAGASSAAVLAGLAAVPKLDTGAWNLPSDMLAMVHKGETVLPVGLAQNFRDMMGGGGGRNGGHTFNFTLNPPTNWTRAQKQREAEEMAGLVANAFARNPSLRPTY